MGGGFKHEPELSGFVPARFDACFSGKFSALPPVVADLLVKNGIPDKVAEKTDRIYCFFDDSDAVTVLLQGDYSNLHAKAYLGVNKRFERHEAAGIRYYVDLESGAEVCIPSESLIIYTELDMAELLWQYNPGGRDLGADFDAFLDADIFLFKDSPAVSRLGAKSGCSIFLNASYDGSSYLLNADLCFDSVHDAKVMSAAVKLFLMDFLKKNGIMEQNGKRRVTLCDDRLLLRSVKVPFSKFDTFFDYFVSGLEER